MEGMERGKVLQRTQPFQMHLRIPSDILAPEDKDSIQEEDPTYEENPVQR